MIGWLRSPISILIVALPHPDRRATWGTDRTLVNFDVWSTRMRASADVNKGHPDDGRDP